MSKNPDNVTSTNTNSPSYLGVKNPLMSPTPLGQKFLQPLGARSISVLDLSLFAGEGVQLQSFDEWDSPFLLESKPNFSNQNIIQEKPLNSVDFTPNAETTSIPQSTETSAIFTSETPEISRELDSPSEELDNLNQDQTKVNYQKSTPSKSTIFRSILGDNISPKSNKFYPPKHPKITEESKSPNPESIQRQYKSSTSEPISDISLIQRLPETSDSVDVNNAIASHDSTIQRLPETSDSVDVNNAIAFHDSSIQRLPETSDSSPIQRLPETSDSVDVNNAIASHDSPIQRLPETSDSSPIQRLPETSDSVDVNAIASHDSPSIQRLSETSDSVEDISNAIASHD
ncbi:hypothetical protein H4N54_22260, partial [Limnospira fusiformis KN01]